MMDTINKRKNLKQRIENYFLNIADQIYLRRLNRKLKDVLTEFLFEPNDDITRNNICSTLNSYFDTVIKKGVIYDVAVVCDNSNNTPTTINAGNIVIDIALKPRLGAKFLHYSFKLGI